MGRGGRRINRLMRQDETIQNKRLVGMDEGMKNGLIVCMCVAVGFIAGVFCGSSVAKSAIATVNLTMENDCRMVGIEYAALEKNYSALKGSYSELKGNCEKTFLYSRCVEADRDFLLKQCGIMPYEVQCPGVGG